MLNIHPSLLPRHKGLHPQQQALDAGDNESGCTVHWVIPALDDGPAILQARVPILPGDTADIALGAHPRRGARALPQGIGHGRAR